MTLISYSLPIPITSFLLFIHHLPTCLFVVCLFMHYLLFACSPTHHCLSLLHLCIHCLLTCTLPTHHLLTYVSPFHLMSLLRLCVACSSLACHMFIVYTSPMPCLLAYVSPTHVPTEHVAPCLTHSQAPC